MRQTASYRNVTPSARGLRRLARLWSLATFAFLLLFLIGEGLSGPRVMPTTMEWIGLLFFPIGLLLGLLLAWRWEGLGGAIAVGSFLLFYLWIRFEAGRWPGGPYFALLAAPGLLFLLVAGWERANASLADR